MDSAKELQQNKIPSIFNFDMDSMGNIDKTGVLFHLHYLPKIVYKKYKLVSEPSSPTSQGLLVPDSENFTIPNLSPYDISFLLKFVNISSLKGIISWVETFGALTPRLIAPNNSQSLDDFTNELYILKTLYQLFSAVNQYALGNQKPLTKRLQIVKLSDHIREWKEKNTSTYKYWGLPPQALAQELEFPCNWNGISFSKTPATIKKSKDKQGYILLIDGEPTTTYLKDNTNVHSILSNVLSVIGSMIDIKLQTCKISPFNFQLQDTSVNYRLSPSIVFSDPLTLLYFQFLWLTSHDETKLCKKCSQYFIPSGSRPGKQLYCGYCSNHPSQDKYKQRQRAAIKEIKNGLPLEDAAQKYNLTVNRLKVILEKGV